MGERFSPTREDVERYRRLRSLALDLNQRILRTIPRQAYTDIGDALGILHNGTLVLDTPDMTSVVADCCIYDWFENGKSVVQRYAEAHPAAPGTDESDLLNAFLHACFRILAVRSVAPGAGLYCQDALNGEELFIMDIGLSHTAIPGETALATRTMPLGEYWMTGGAGLPLPSRALDTLCRVKPGTPRRFEDPNSIALTVVRACLASGAAESVRYAVPTVSRREPRHRFKRR